MKNRLPFAVFLVVLVAASGCGRRDKASPSPSPTVAVATPTPAPTPLPPLLDPTGAVETAPERFRVRFETTEGPFVVEVRRKWAPNGADRFYNLVKLAYYDGVTFFRVLDDFMAQFGIHGDPKVSRVWRNAQIPDDPVTQSNKRGMVTFATAGPGTRTTQIFINYKDNSNLDGMGFAPFGRVVEGLSVVDKLYSDYGEGAPRGLGPDQARAQSEGNDYFRRDFPKLDHIKTARVEAPAPREAP
jgi:peptidyl-prolyl cis-trans isomerase A (cyclophilin A)